MSTPFTGERVVEGSDCFVVQSTFYDGKSYTRQTINSRIKKLKMGKSQCKKDGTLGSTRVTYVRQNFFNEEERRQILGDEYLHI